MCPDAFCANFTTLLFAVIQLFIAARRIRKFRLQKTKRTSTEFGNSTRVRTNKVARDDTIYSLTVANMSRLAASLSSEPCCYEL